MDTSEEYIKMCDCEEIQSNDMGGLYMFNHGPIRGNFYTSDTEIGKSASCDIWLPRQDQIQEMADRTDPRIKLYIDNVIETLPFCDTWEKFWLVFYMHEKHGKIWDGEKWVKRR